MNQGLFLESGFQELIFATWERKLCIFLTVEGETMGSAGSVLSLRFLRRREEMVKDTVRCKGRQHRDDE